MNMPSLDYKKIFLIIGFIIVSFFLSFLLYWVFFRSSSPGETNINFNGNFDITNRNFNGPGGNFPDSEGTTNLNGNINGNVNAISPSSTLRQFSDIRIRGMELDNNQDIVYYNRDDGKFYRINKNQEIEIISDQIFFSAEDVFWSRDKKKVIVEYPDGANILYNFDEEKQFTIPADWQDFQFFSDNDVISKNIGDYEEQNVLITSNVKTGKVNIIDSLGANIDNTLILPSPDGRIVSILVKTINMEKQELNFIGQRQENFDTINVDGIGFEGKWSPDSKKILYSVFSAISNWQPELWIINRDGSNKRRIGVKTWTDKCVFYSNTIIYCGVPQKLEEMSGFSKNFSIPYDDDLYRIDSTENDVQFVTTLAGGHNIKDITISRDEAYIYFTDARDGKLYQLELP